MANKSIKGITIEIDGNATGLDKALKGVNSTSVKLNSELKDVNKLLKFDPSNATGLAQKQELLTKSIENTSQKLQQLKAAQGEVEAQFKSGKIGEEQYRAFQREIVTTEQSLAGYKRQLSGLQEEQDKLSQNTKRLDTFFEATGKSIDDFSDILGNRMVSAIKNGTATSDQLEVALNKIGKEALGTETDLSKMKQSLDKIDDGGSLNEVKSDLAELSPKADEASDSISDMADSLSSGKMMQATELLSSVGDKVLEIGTNAKDSALEFSSAFGTLNATTNLSGQEMEKLKAIATDVFESGVTDSIDEAVEATSLMKSSFSELNNQDLGKLTEQVINLSKRTGTDVQENVKGASQLMNAFGLDATTAFDLVASGYQNNLNYSGDFMDTLNEYAPLFAQAGYSADEMLTILQNGMENGAMNTDKTADAVKELQIRMGDGSLEGVLSNFGEETQSTFQKWKDGQATVSDVATSIQTDLQKMTPSEQQQALSLLSTQFEDLGIGAATSLFDVEKGFDDVSGAMDKASEKDPSQEWQASLNTFTTSLQEIGTKILIALQPVLDWFSDLTSAFNGLSEPVQNTILIFGGLTAVIAIIAPIIAAIMAIGSTVFGIAAVIAAAIAYIILIFQNWGTIVDWLKSLWQGFSDWISGLWQSIGVIAGSVWSSITTTISSVVQSCISVVQGLWSSASGFISGIWNGIASTASSIWNGITSAISSAINQASSIVSSIVNGISSTISSVFGGIQSTVTSIWNGIKSAIEGPINTAKDIVKGAIDAIKGFFNFSISWPHIPMPHFGISPSGWSVGDLLKGSIPKLSIDWYANGGILTKPTVFGQNGNSLMVGGEAGKEAVAPLSDLMAYVEAAVANQLGKSEEKYNQMIYLLSQLVNKQTIIMMDSTPVGRLVTPTVMDEMTAKETMINKAWGRGKSCF